MAIAAPIEAPRVAPKWLSAAHERIREEPASVRVDALARDAGVHRVHFSRLFDAIYGTPPSVFRRRAMLEHAIAGMLARRGSLADAASEAGFADQAHMSRAFSEFLSVSPARLRAFVG
jgi:AraC family transcriptional regulator